MLNEDFNLELEPDTEPETTNGNVQPDSQCSSASEEILFHGKKAKSRKVVKSRKYIDDESSDDLEQLEQLADQLCDIDSEDDDDEDPPKVNPHVQST